MSKTAIIIGAGPAGLTAAYELVNRTDIKPILFEADHQVGGISRTVNYKGNRIDIGGHRFFSKSQRVMNWWEHILPFQTASDAGESVTLTYQNKTTQMQAQGRGANPDEIDDVMLVRPRVSRILYNRKFFDYPISFSWKTLSNLGLLRSVRIGFSYLRASAFPIRPETSLRHFIINRFGRELYATFFENYTEKVWGVPCEQIPAEWGAQRIKGLSVVALLKNALKKIRREGDGIAQKDTETSLIERFLYPKHGPGQLWEKVARQVEADGGEIHLLSRVVAIHHQDGSITAVDVVDSDGIKRRVEGDLVFSTMPIKDLIEGFEPAAPTPVADVASGLPYRDFLTVGLLLDELAVNGGARASELAEKVPDNWIYVQEPDVTVGRIQIFNNWSPYLVAEPDRIWIGLEYFVDESDEIWSQPDEKTVSLAVAELDRLGFSAPEAVQDAVVVRTPKAYPAYFGTYDQIQTVRDHVADFDNLYLIGRNGMHRYNNQDHSMLTAMVAVDGIVEAVDNRDALWDINAEQEYHEEK
ncbi:NAD(P)/FAD-dependent oxidoreductase [Aliiroseovarius subalbicans]|uniref:NAD(P)/FAD-dependent oxidoreductase n=1 Tax=Aliiroseovarius subalbicans TaxID=2925840 RepID=UPI001F599237|nr:NAD(P)/FAD-dependent oxidoreductase [Aliiroseovarius subalbicans]MCI2400428.1 NAD(P)/FAD-dependent oxidoreductase [Aliiroseovarius subalbicans]